MARPHAASIVEDAVAPAGRRGAAQPGLGHPRHQPHRLRVGAVRAGARPGPAQPPAREPPRRRRGRHPCASCAPRRTSSAAGARSSRRRRWASPSRSTVGDRTVHARSDRSGHIDVVGPRPRPASPGWHDVTISSPRAPRPSRPSRAVVGRRRDASASSATSTTRSSRTSLPRPMIAAWNTFVRARAPATSCPGMAPMYRELLAEHPGAPIVYVSTGAWNTAPTLNRFLATHGFPLGPLLLTDWGPTNTGLVPQRPGAQARLPRPAGQRLPRHPLAARRRRRPARPEDLRRLRRGPPATGSTPSRSAQLTPDRAGAVARSAGLQRGARAPAPPTAGGAGLLARPTATACCAILAGRRSSADVVAGRSDPALAPGPRADACAGADWRHAGAARGPGARRLPRRADRRPRRHPGRARRRSGAQDLRPAAAARSRALPVDGVAAARQVPRPRRRRPRTSSSTWPGPAGCAGATSCPHTVLRPGKSPLALRVRFSDGSGFDLTEAGTKKSLAAYVVRDPHEVPGIARLGPDPLADDFTPRRVRRRSSTGRRTQIKGVLRDQAFIAGIGNAYSDEILHAAKMSPFAIAGIARRRGRATGCTPRCATRWPTRSSRRPGKPAKELKDAKRAGMRVHGRTGQPCPVCGDTVREVSFADSSLQYCPTCQTGGKPLADRGCSMPCALSTTKSARRRFSASGICRASSASSRSRLTPRSSTRARCISAGADTTTVASTRLSPPVSNSSGMSSTTIRRAWRSASARNFCLGFAHQRMHDRFQPLQRRRIAQHALAAAPTRSTLPSVVVPGKRRLDQPAPPRLRKACAPPRRRRAPARLPRRTAAPSWTCPLRSSR